MSDMVIWNGAKEGHAPISQQAFQNINVSAQHVWIDFA